MIGGIHISIHSRLILLGVQQHIVRFGLIVISKILQKVVNIEQLFGCGAIIKEIKLIV